MMTYLATLTMRVCIRLLIFGLLLLALSSGGGVRTAKAFATCPDATAMNPATAIYAANLDTGTCTISVSAPTNGLTAALTPGATEMIVASRDGGVQEIPKALTCPSGNTTIQFFVNNARVNFAGTGSCNFTATVDISGTIVTMTGTVSFDVPTFTMSATNVIVFGGIFGAAPPPAATGLTASGKSNTVAALQSSFDAATPGVLDTVTGAENGAGNGSGFAFTPMGLGFVQSRVDTGNPLDRYFGDDGQGMRLAGTQPYGFTSNKSFNVSLGLRELMRSAESRASYSMSPRGLSPGSIGGSARLTDGMDPGNKSRDDNENYMSLHGASLKDGGYRPRSRVNAWVKGEYVEFDDGERNADRDGHLWVVTSGLGVQVGARTNIGLISRYREGEADSQALDASLNSSFYGGGFYLTAVLGGRVRLSVAALWEQGDNDIAIAGATGDFDSRTTTVEGRIDKRIRRGSSWIEPMVSLRYVDSAQDTYTDSTGVLVANRDLTLGRLAFGPTVGTTIYRGGVELRPFAKVNGVWDFENKGNFATSTAGTFASGDNAVNLGGGIEVAFASGLVLKLAGDWFAFDTEFEGWALSGGFGAPLSALGLGGVTPASLVSLDLAAREGDASAQARIRIPLGKQD